MAVELVKSFLTSSGTRTAGLGSRLKRLRDAPRCPFRTVGVAKIAAFSISHRRGRCPHRPAESTYFMVGFRRNRVDFPSYAVGADDSVRSLKSCNFVRSFVGADAHIGPSKYCDFASDFHKSGQFRRADRVVRPYGAKWQTDTLSAAQTSAPPRMSMTFPSSVRRSVSQQVMSTCPERI